MWVNYCVSIWRSKWVTSWHVTWMISSLSRTLIACHVRTRITACATSIEAGHWQLTWCGILQSPSGEACSVSSWCEIWGALDRRAMARDTDPEGAPHATAGRNKPGVVVCVKTKGTKWQKTPIVVPLSGSPSADSKNAHKWCEVVRRQLSPSPNIIIKLGFSSKHEYMHRGRTFNR